MIAAMWDVVVRAWLVVAAWYGLRRPARLRWLASIGHPRRFMRGAIVPGGVADTVDDAVLAELPGAVGRLVAEFFEIAELSLDNSLVLERLQGTGRLTTATAREMQVVGLVARASGIDADLRRDAPFAAYDKLDVIVPTYETGDVWARTIVRIREAREAARLIVQAVEQVPGGPMRVDLPPLREGDQVSAVESWRGPIWYWVMAGGPDRVDRVKIADPSFRNWPSLEYAVLNNIVPDFPLCNKSFNLSYSGNDL